MCGMIDILWNIFHLAVKFGLNDDMDCTVQLFNVVDIQ